MTLRKLVSSFGLFVVIGVMAFVAGRWIGVQAADLYARWFPQPGFEQADNRAYFASVSEPVLLFGTESCPYCTQTRALFEQLGVSYREFRIDASDQARRLYAGLGAQGVPVTLIGDRRIYGYREDVLRESLAELSSRTSDVPTPPADASP